MDVLAEMQKTITATMTSEPEENECPMCHGSGWVMYEDDNGCLWQKECECGIRQQMIMKSRLKFASIPELYKNTRLKDLSLSAYQNGESREIFKVACKAIKYWLDNLDTMIEKGKGLYFVSRYKGCGKTMTASALANELIYEKHIPVKFATFNQILDAIKATYDKESAENESKLIGDLQSVKVLFIDEFGLSKATPWVNEKFYTIINGRYNNKLPTIFTSNLNLKDTTQAGYDERITDRIAEMCFSVLFPGESVRQNIHESDRKGLGL